MIEGIEKGDTFYEVMKKQGNTYPNLLKSMVLAGESSGTIDLIMEKMAILLTSGRAVKKLCLAEFLSRLSIIYR